MTWSSISHKSTRWQNYKMAKRFILVDDLNVAQFTMSNTSSKKQTQSQDGPNVQQQTMSISNQGMKHLVERDILARTILQRQNEARRKLDTYTTTKQNHPTVPKEKKEKKSGKGKQKTTELETISEAVLTEAAQLKIITKRSRKETHSSHASGSGADETNWMDEDDDVHDGTNVDGAKSDEDANILRRIRKEAVDSDTMTNLKEEMNTPATTTSSSLQNLPNFASLFGFDYRLKALEDNFSELRQTNQYAEALSSIPGIVDQYLANKMQEAVDVAVQLKYDRIREVSNTENQQFLDSNSLKELKK
ncbi:hypothetical protein Tco_0014360 [Tanacetum coccineum]